jgi:hypothetical protein
MSATQFSAPHDAGVLDVNHLLDMAVRPPRFYCSFKENSFWRFALHPGSSISFSNWDLEDIRNGEFQALHLAMGRAHLHSHAHILQFIKSTTIFILIDVAGEKT